MCLPVSGWRHPGYGFEYAVKMCQIGKACLITDLRDVFICFHEFSLSIHDPGGIHILDYRAVGMTLEFPAQIIRADIESASQFFQADILLIVSVNIADYLAHPVAVFLSGRLLPLYLKNDRKQQHI